MDGLCELVRLVVATGVGNRHGSVQWVEATKVALSLLHLFDELGVLGIQFDVRELDQLRCIFIASSKTHLRARMN